MRAGVAAIASAVNSFASRCPNSQLVIVGYSQGAQITDNAFCGGPDANQGYSTTTPAFSAAAMNQIKAVIEMGNPRFRSGVAYQVGTCKTQGFSPRPQGYSCSVRIRCQNVLKRNPKLIRINSPQARSKATATARTPTAAPATTQTCTRATAKSTARLHSLSSRVSSATAPEAAAEAVAAPLRLRLPPARAARLRLLRLRGAAVLPSGASVVGKGESLYHFSSWRGECFLGVFFGEPTLTI
jgi:alpha-beta hydrolase superfamily lysophospholipase